MEVCKPAKTFTWQIPWCRCVPDGSRPHLRQVDASVRHRSGSHDLMRSESCRLQSTRCFGTSRGLQDHPLDQRVSLVQPRPNSIQHGLLISQHSTEQRAISASPAGTRTRRSRPRGAAADFAGPRWTPGNVCSIQRPQRPSEVVFPQMHYILWYTSGWPGWPGRPEHIRPAVHR